MFLLAALSVTALNCFKEPVTPVAPSWDVDVTFPIGTKNVTVAEIIEKDSTLVRSDVSNRLVYSTTMNATPTYVGNQLSISPAAATAHVQLGTFAVHVDPVVLGVNLTSIPPGAVTYVPPITMAFPDLHVATSAGSVTLRSGSVTMSVRNNLPVAISAQQPVQLLNNDGVIEAEFDFSGTPLQPGQTRTATSDLSGKTLSSGVNVTGLTFSTTGSQGVVAFPTDSMLVVRMSFADLRASMAEVAMLPAQRLVDNDQTTIALNDSTVVKEVAVQSGQLRFTFTNRIDVGVLFKFRLEELYRQTNGRLAPYEDSVLLPASGSQVYTMNLAGCELQADPGQLLRSLKLISSVIIPDAVTRSVAVHDTDKVQIAMRTMSPIVADSVVGAIKPTWVEINTTVPFNKAKIPSRLKANFNIPSASLTFLTTSTVGYPADLYVTFTARRSDGQLVTLDIPASQRRLLPGGGAIAFDGAEVGRFLSQFSNGLPDSLRISGKVLVNPSDVYTTDPERVGSVSRNCFIGGSVNLEIPMTLGVTQATYRDTANFGVNENGAGKKPAQDEIRRVNSAKLHVEVTNGLPAEVGVRIRLLDRLHQTVLTLPQSGAPFRVVAAGIDGAGYSANPGMSTFVIDLSHEEAQQYVPAEFVDYELEMLTSQGGSTVSFRTSDAVSVRVWTQCSYGVNK